MRCNSIENDDDNDNDKIWLSQKDDEMKLIFFTTRLKRTLWFLSCAKSSRSTAKDDKIN